MAGYAAVSVEQIAGAGRIKAPSLYRHFRNKREIFDNILRETDRRDAAQAAAAGLLEEPTAAAPAAYEHTSTEALVAFSRAMFRYWTEDPFAAAFRRMLTLEQYQSAEMQRLYQQYLGDGPLGYVADLLGSQTEALLFYGPMHLLYSVYDGAADKRAVAALLEEHWKRWSV